MSVDTHRYVREKREEKHVARAKAERFVLTATAEVNAAAAGVHVVNVCRELARNAGKRNAA